MHQVSVSVNLVRAMLISVPDKPLQREAMMRSDQDYRNCRRCSPQLQRPKMPPVRRIHGFAYASLVFAATELACIAGGEAPAPAGRPATQAPAVR